MHASNPGSRREEQEPTEKDCLEERLTVRDCQNATPQRHGDLTGIERETEVDRDGERMRENGSGEGVRGSEI